MLKKLLIPIAVIVLGGIAFILAIDLPRKVPQSTTQSSDESNFLTILATGDIMLGRFVETLSNRNGDQYPFEKIEPFLAGYDLVFGNLEGPILSNHKQTPDFTTVFSFASKVATLLKSNHFDLVTIANNHTFDHGEAGYQQTANYLDEAMVKHFGHPQKTDTNYVQIVEENGQTVVFIGFNKTTNDFDLETAIKTIETERATYKKAFIIVTPHWGTEYQRVGNKAQQELAHKFIDAGADTVIGHHPHVVQNVEVYKGKAIFYSLGNFIFDQYFSPYTQEGLTIALELSDKKAKYTLRPVQILKSQPEPLPNEKLLPWLQDLAQRSDALLADQIASGILDLAR